MRIPRKTARIALLMVAAIVLLPLLAFAEGGIPHDAARHQRALTRHAQAVWGLDAPVAVFAAQIHQESRWRANASSTVGAQGMAQFMPATAEWISGAYRLGPAQPNNPAWAIRALVVYDKVLFDQFSGAEMCDRMVKALWAYNGGAGWVARDERRAAQAGKDARLWRDVEPFNAGRNADAFRENRDYPRAIIFKWQPIYSLWGGVISCAPG